MHIFIVYAHPSTDSFTFHAKNAFVEGMLSAGHTFELSDLYAMGFRTDMSEVEYLREANYDSSIPVLGDVKAEQEKINRCDAIAFVYPVFWTEAPAKLVGWFDRVWTTGFAYGERTMKKLEKALVLCVAGRTTDHLLVHGHLDAMKSVMLVDRIFDRAKESEMIVLDGMTKAEPSREENWQKHLKTAFEAGRTI